MIDVVEILQHWHAGRPKTVVAASLGVDPKTVRKYVAPAEAAGLVPGGPPLGRAEWSALVRGWFPELVDARARSLTYPVLEGYRARIEQMLKTNTVTTVHQRLRDEAGLEVGSAASAVTYGRSSPSTWTRTRSRSCALRWAPGRRRRSTTGSSAAGSTRSPSGGGGCGRS